MCEYVCAYVCVCHVTTLRARYEVVSISRLLQAALFYYHASLPLHKCVCVFVFVCARSSVCVCTCMHACMHARSPYNISYPAPSLLILRRRFTTLHYICPVILFHPSHGDAHALTGRYMRTRACVCVFVCVSVPAAASQTCVTRVWRWQIHIKSHPIRGCKEVDVGGTEAREALFFPFMLSHLAV